MENIKDLLDLTEKDSLVRTPFRGILDLRELDLPTISFPIDGFKDISFIPKRGLDLEFLSESLRKRLSNMGVTKDYIRKTTSSLFEAIKNAYEHGNKESPEKLILLAESIDEKNVEFLVGDIGGRIDANLIPYLLLFRQGKHKEFYTDIEDFYSFKGDMFAPSGHSGAGTKVIHTGFENVKYFKNQFSGLTLYLSKKFSK